MDQAAVAAARMSALFRVQDLVFPVLETMAVLATPKKKAVAVAALALLAATPHRRLVALAALV